MNYLFQVLLGRFIFRTSKQNKQDFNTINALSGVSISKNISSKKNGVSEVVSINNSLAFVVVILAAIYKYSIDCIAEM